MHPETNASLRTQQAILSMLVFHRERPWSLAEVEREIGEDAQTRDALAQLYAVGLVHRWDEFVFATRAAVHSERLTF